MLCDCLIEVEAVLNKGTEIGSFEVTVVGVWCAIEAKSICKDNDCIRLGYEHVATRDGGVATDVECVRGTTEHSRFSGCSIAQ